MSVAGFRRALRAVQAYVCLFLLVSQSVVAPCSATTWMPVPAETEQAPVTVIPNINMLDSQAFSGQAELEHYSTDAVYGYVLGNYGSPRHTFEPFVHPSIRGRAGQSAETKSDLFESKRKPVHISASGQALAVPSAEPKNASEEAQAGGQKDGQADGQKDAPEPKAIEALRISLESTDGKHVLLNSTKADAGPAKPPTVASKNEPLAVRRLYPQWNEQSVHDMPVPGIVLGFSKPMATVEEVASNSTSRLIASVVPPMSGSWRWLNSKTLMFEPEKGALDLGTTYDINVPKGTKSLDGKLLEQDFTSSFDTGLSNPLIDFTMPEFSVVFIFKNHVKVESLASRIEAKIDDAPKPHPGFGFAPPTVPSEKPLALKLASDEQARRLLGARYKKDQTFAFVADKQPPDGSRVSLSLREGVESLTGSSKTTNAITTGFFVQSKQMVVQRNYSERSFEPGEPLDVVFNQMLAENNKSDRISVSPPLKNMQLGFSGYRLYLKGDTVPGGKYTVTIKRGFKSKERTLEADQEVEFRVGSFKPRLIPPAYPYALMNLSAPAYPVRSVNVDRLRVRVFDDEDERIASWTRQNSLAKHELFGTPMLDLTVQPQARPNQIATTSIDLSKLIREGKHQFYIYVEQVGNDSVQERNGQGGPLWPVRQFSAMVQVSDLKATCFPLENKLAFWVTDGRTGMPVPGARVSRIQKHYEPVTGDTPPEELTENKRENAAQDEIAVTDADGIAWLPFEAASAGGSPFLISTRKDKLVVYGQAASMLLGVVRASRDKEMTVPDRKNADAYLKFELPFESSVGVLACKSNTRFDLVPVKFDSNTGRVAAPVFKPDDEVLHFVLKVYDTSAGGKDTAPSSRRSALISFSVDPRAGDPSDVVRYPASLRKGALPAQVSLEIKPETVKEIKKMPRGDTPEVRFAMPTSVDGIPALNDLLVGLEFQVGEIHNRYHSTHSFANRGNFFPIPMSEAYQPEKAVPIPAAKAPKAKSEAVVAFPKSVCEDDTINLCIQIRNAQPMTSPFSITIKSKDDSKSFFEKNVDIESGVTDVYIDNFETIVAQLQGQGAALHVRETNGTESWDLEFDSAIRPRYKESKKFLSGISGSAVNRSVLDEKLSKGPLKAKLQLANYCAPIIKELEYRFESTPLLSSNFRAARLIAFLERQRLDKSPQLEKIIKDDVSAFEEVSRTGFEWKSWMPTGEHQSEHGTMYKWSPYLMAEALLTAQEAGLEFDKNGMNSFLFRGEFTFLKGQKEIPRELAQLQSLACYQTIRGLQGMYKDQPEALKHDQQRFAKLLDEWLADRDVSIMDGEELAWTVMACRLLRGSTLTKNALESRLWKVASRSAAEDAANRTVPPRTARTVQEQGQLEPIEPVTDEATAYAALLLAVMDDNAPKDIHDNPEIVSNLTKKLEKNFYETGWPNLAKAGFCLRALYKSNKLLGKLATRGSGSFGVKDGDKAEFETFKFSEGHNELREYTVALAPERPFSLEVLGDVHYSVNVGSLDKSAELPAESDLFALKRILMPADPSSSVWRTADGVWHCKKDSKVKMRVFLIPKNDMDWLVTMVPFPAGFQPIQPKEEITYDSVPVYENDPGIREIYNRIPQKINEKDDRLELYSRKLVPLLYRFDYDFKAANTGTFYLPPVQINKVFDSREFARTGYDTVVIEE